MNDKKMALTPEQLEQCRANFEDKYIDADGLPILDFTLDPGHPNQYDDNETEYHWRGFQAAWRPIPSVEDIMKIMSEVCSRKGQVLWDDMAQAIHRAFGGEK